MQAAYIMMLHSQVSYIEWLTRTLEALSDPYCQSTCLYSVSQKIPLRFADIFPQTDGIFFFNFYAPIIRCLLYTSDAAAE